MQKMKVQFIGVGPMIMHNGRLANPLSPESKYLAEVTHRRKKNDEDLEEISWREFKGGLYIGDDGSYVIPAHNVEAAIEEGARKHRLGKAASSGCIVTNDAKLKFKGDSKTPEQLFETNAFRVTVRVGQSCVLRTRPIIDDWSIVVEIEFAEDIISEAELWRALEVAGREKGIGDWRPKYGRFTLKRW